MKNLTREFIESLSDVEPYCFETDREEQWFNVGLKYGLNVADSDPKSLIPELPKRIGDKIIEREIGEIFKYNDVKLQVFEHGDAFKCNECYFVHRGIECTKQLCLRNQRNDRQSVIFKLIH